MSGRRERLDIINDILELIRDKNTLIRPTQIMYKANLSHEMLNVYMKELCTKGFVIENKLKTGKRTYALTDKGYNFLRDYKIIKGFVDSYDLSE